MNTETKAQFQLEKARLFNKAAAKAHAKALALDPEIEKKMREDLPKEEADEATPLLEENPFLADPQPSGEEVAGEIVALPAIEIIEG